MIKGINHVGISVKSLERSLLFYRDLLGMRVVEEEPFEGPLYENIMALKGARGKAAVIEIGNLQIELFEFSHPEPRRADPNRPVCDHGISHFCIEVSDIDAEYRRLSDAGVRFHSAPLDFGPVKATYCRDPDGNVFELIDLSARCAAGNHGGA